MATLVRDLMSKELITVEPSYDLGVALALMYEYDVHRLPVIETNEENGESYLIGIITDRDVRLAIDSPYLHNRDDNDALEHLREILVADAMNGDPVLVTADMTVAEAAQRMLDEHVGGLPVVEHTGEEYPRLLGIVTRSDMLSHLIKLEHTSEAVSR